MESDHIDLSIAHRWGFHAFPDDPEAPRGLSKAGLWAWDLGYRLAQHLKTAGISLFLLLLFVGTLKAQPATVVVTDTLRLANGTGFCGGTINVAWSTFTSTDGFRIQGGNLPVPVNPTTGVFAVNLVPTNDSTTPASGFYSVRFDLRPNNCAPATMTWHIPLTGPAHLPDITSISSPPPPSIPLNSLEHPLTSATWCIRSIGGVINWSTSCGGGIADVVGTARQIQVVSGGGMFTVSLPADLLLSGQSADGTDVLTASRFTDTTPTGNFINFKALGGTSLWKVDIAGVLQAGSVPWARISSVTAANIVSLFSTCSGVQYLGADGACHSTGGGGSVTDFSAGTLSPLFTTSVATSTSTPALSFILTNAAQNAVLAGPTSGTGAPTYRALVGGDLPNPSASTLGGVQSKTVVTHQFLNTISTAGVPGSAQPTCGDLSDSAAGCSATSLPPNGTAGGDLSGTYPNPTVAQVNGAVVPTSANVLASNGSKQLVLASQSTRARAIGAGFDGAGSALTSGSTKTTYFTVPFACTISGWNITVDTGTITFDVWKIATGTAIPTVANTITAAALPAISTGTAVHSTTLTAWTTAVAVNDIFGVNINTVATATKASLVLECDI